MGTVAQSSSKMQGLLVLASLAVASAQVLPLGYHGLGLGYAGIVHPYAAHVVKPVVKEVEVPVTTLKFEVAETGCKNSFGNPVPCKREAEDAVEVGAEAAPAEAAAPAAAAVLPLGLPFGYAGVGYHGIGLPALTYAAPTVTEVEVPQYKFVPKEKVVELQPACQNAWGFGVPCA